MEFGLPEEEGAAGGAAGGAGAGVTPPPATSVLDEGIAALEGATSDVS